MDLVTSGPASAGLSSFGFGGLGTPKQRTIRKARLDDGTFADLKKDITPWKTNMTMEYYLLYIILTFIIGDTSSFMVVFPASQSFVFCGVSLWSGQAPTVTWSSKTVLLRKHRWKSSLYSSTSRLHGSKGKGVERKIAAREKITQECLAEIFGSSSDIWKQQKGVSKNSGTPKSSIFNRVFHYKPSILGYHYFWKHPEGFVWLLNCLQLDLPNSNAEAPCTAIPKPEDTRRNPGGQIAVGWEDRMGR